MNKFGSLKYAGALMILALAYFFDGQGLIPALAAAAIIHELGHIAAIELCGAKISGIRTEALGLRIDYYGILNRRKRIIIALAGPAAGVLYAFTSFYVSNHTFILSCKISAWLTAFNVMPILPLDGGRILIELCNKHAAKKVSVIVSLCLIVFGISVAIKSHIIYAAAAGIWLLAYNTVQ